MICRLGPQAVAGKPGDENRQEVGAKFIFINVYYVNRHYSIASSANVGRGEIMLAFLESTWPICWILAMLILLRWFHVNARTPDDSETCTRTPAVPPASRGASPQAI